MMTAAPKPKLTEAEYLAIENAAEFKSEFYNGVMYPLHRDEVTGMAGASRFHNRVKENLIGELFIRFKDGPCQSFSSDQRVRLTDSGMFAYPDILVVFAEPQFSEADPNTLVNPQVVIEVLSPSTENYDRGFKFAQYQLQQSIREYVLVSQNAVRIERFVRQPNNSWVLTIFTDQNGEFSLETIPARIPIADIYRSVAFLKEATP